MSVAAGSVDVAVPSPQQRIGETLSRRQIAKVRGSTLSLVPSGLAIALTGTRNATRRRATAWLQMFCQQPMRYR